MAAGGVFGPTDQVFYLFILGCVPIFKAGFLLLLPGRGAIGLTLPVFHAVPVDESKRERERERKTWGWDSILHVAFMDDMQERGNI